MPQEGRIVGIDVSKLKVDACIRSLQLRLSQPSTMPGHAALLTRLCENGVGLAVMEATGGYEQSWVAALRRAGIAVRIIDPKRVRYFAKSAGRLAKNDPIEACPRAGHRPDPGAAIIAWFAETFASEPEPADDPERVLLDRLVTARATLVELAVRIGQLGEHDQPRGCAGAPSDRQDDQGTARSARDRHRH